MLVASIARYWGRKPLEIVRETISDGDDVVVDPFGGSGTITLAALERGRRVVYADINPYAWLIAHVLIAGADYEEFSDAVPRVLEAARSRTSWRTRLRGDRLRYPTGSPFMKRRRYDRVSDLFPENNMRILFSILRAIDELRVSARTKLALYLAFCNTLFPSSYMKRRGSGSWGVPCYWVPPENEPEDPPEVFARAAERLARFIKYGRFYRVGYSLRDLTECDAVLLLANALTLRYSPSWTIITDPPHLDEVQYMELSFFYWAWLRESRFREVVEQLLGRRPRFNISKEISVNPNRGTDLSTYLESIKRFMLRVRRARRKVVIFHEEDSKVLDRVVEYSRSIWGAVRVDYIRIDNQRKVGPRGDVTYIVLKSPY